MNPYTLDTLRGGSPARLSRYRRARNESLQTIRSHRTPEAAEEFIRANGSDNIRNYRGAWLGEACGPRCDDDGEHVYLPASVMDAFRYCGEAHDLIDLRHSGWYTDPEAGDLIVGCVWQLPARRGESLYLAGYVEGDNGYATLDASRGQICVFDDKDDAARAADELAERDAEKERVCREKWRAAREVEDARERRRGDLRKARSEAHALVLVLRDLAPGSANRPTLCRLIAAQRYQMRVAIRRIAEDSQRLAEFAAAGVEA